MTRERWQNMVDALHPRSVVKRPVATVLFTLLATAAGFVADVKLVRAAADGLGGPGTPLSVLGLLVIATSAILFLVAYLTLQVRYVIRAQALAASCLFLLLTAGASSFGHALRMKLAPPEGEQSRPFSPSAYTLREAMVTFILLTVSGTIFTAVHNVTFPRKADYTEFAAHRQDLLLQIADAARRYNAGHVLTRVDAKRAGQCCEAALAALDKATAADEPQYRRFITAHVRPAVRELCEFIVDPSVQQMPDLLLKACGLTLSRGPLAQEQVTRISRAYRALQGTR